VISGRLVYALNLELDISKRKVFVAVESIPIYGVLRSLLRWLPTWLLRRHYTAARLEKLIYFDFLPRCESARLDLAEAASISLALQLINLSPFYVEFDRGQYRFVYAGATINLNSLNRKTIAPGESMSLHLQEAISDGYATQIAQNLHGNQAWLEGSMEFNCRVRQFAKNIGNMSGIQLSVINPHIRTHHTQIKR
jgi:hypothetical protein